MSKQMLTNLNLAANKLRPKGVISIAKALKGGAVLKNLNLYKNRIGDAGTIAISESLKSNKVLERLDLGFQELLQREPHPEERKLLRTLYDRQLKRYIQSPQEANELLKVGLHPAGREANPMDLAAFTSVTRALLNLHETITRY